MRRRMLFKNWHEMEKKTWRWWMRLACIEEFAFGQIILGVGVNIVEIYAESISGAKGGIIGHRAEISQSSEHRLQSKS